MCALVVAQLLPTLALPLTHASSRLADISCKYCQQQQACAVYVSKEFGPMRSYDTYKLIEQMHELQKKHGTPAEKGITKSEKFLTAQGAAHPPSRKGSSYPWQNEPKPSNASVHVPKDAQPGDQMVLKCNDGRKVKVIVEAVE